MSKTSIIIPARNEAKNITITLQGIVDVLIFHQKAFEIVVIDDGSTDNTSTVVELYGKRYPEVRVVRNEGPHGIGNALRVGLSSFTGDWVIIAMADASDDPQDMLKYILEMEKGIDCCFGTRWKKGTTVSNYPLHKRLLNRIVNQGIRIFFGLKYNDVTNAFKCYSRETMNGITPIISHHFNITVELPLKAIIRGYSYQVVSTNWYGRKIGISSLKINEMGSRYLFIILYMLLEKLLAKGDYRKR